MIRATLITDTGPIALLGISDENVRRLRAGMPLDIHLKEMTPKGKKIIRVVIHLAHTYEEVVDDWEKGGIPITNVLRREAQAMDELIAEEKKQRDATS
jgi:hypothetical protein